MVLVTFYLDEMTVKILLIFYRCFVCLLSYWLCRNQKHHHLCGLQSFDMGSVLTFLILFVCLIVCMFVCLFVEMRSKRHRYTEWVSWNHKTFQPDWLDVKGVELYDHHVDPEENINLSGRPGLESLENKLRSQLRQQF